MRGNGPGLLPKVRNLVLESIFRLVGEVGTRSSWSSIPNRFRTGRSPTRNRSTLGSKSLPVVIPDRTTFVGAFPKAARRRRGSKKYPIGLLNGHSCLCESTIADGEPAMKPGLKAIVVPVYEISIIVPFVTDSKSRNSETS